MTKLKNWVGLCALLLSLQVNAGEINVQDAWIRSHPSAQENAMVGMVISSVRPARIISAISPAFMSVAIQGPGKSPNKTQEIEFIELPAQKSVMLSADSVHLLLSGNRQTLGAADKVPVFLTVQFEDKTSKTITVMAQPVLSKSAATTPLSSKVATPASTVVPQPQPAPSKVIASPEEEVIPPKPVVAVKPAVAVVIKPAKTAPVPAPKPAPAPVAARVVAAPVPVTVPVPIVSPAPIVAAPSVAPIVVEPKKAPEAKPAEQPKQEDERTTAECIDLADEIRSCDRSNDTMLAWCETNAKSRSSCKLSMEQLKKLKN